MEYPFFASYSLVFFFLLSITLRALLRMLCQMFMYVWNYVWILRCYSVDWLTITCHQPHIVHTTFLFFFPALDSMDIQNRFFFIQPAFPLNSGLQSIHHFACTEAFCCFVCTLHNGSKEDRITFHRPTTIHQRTVHIHRWMEENKKNSRYTQELGASERESEKEEEEGKK